MWTESARRLGFWSAAAIIAIGIIYILTGLLGVLMRPPGLPMLAQVDPWLAILEFLIILSAIALVALMAAIHAFSPPEAKAAALAALAFAAGFAVLTCALHFASLTIGRQDAAGRFEFSWPSLALSLDLLAWELLLGLALLFAAPAFGGDRLQKAIRVTAFAAGALCLFGVIGPLSGDLRFELPAIFGRAFVLPALCFLLAGLFARPLPASHQ